MARTHEQFITEIARIHPNITILGTYTKAVEPIAVQCKICKKVWNPKAYGLLQGKGCPHCSAIKGALNNKGKTGLKTTEQFKKELHEIDESIDIVGEYTNTHTNINCRCNRCDHEWDAKPYSLLQGHGCPRCAKSGTSFMEQLILGCFRFVLGKGAVLSRDKKMVGLEIDILIPSLKFAIEPGNWYLHRKAIERDREKRKRCSEKGIRLITIYDKFPKEMEKPFDMDCLVFYDDLNKIEHNTIYNLIYQLFLMCGINRTFSKQEWQELERIAYLNSKSFTHEDFVNKLSYIRPEIEVLGRYENANRRIKVRCKKCSFEWYGVPANLLVGDGCRKCGTKEAHKKLLKSQAEFETELQIINPTIKILGEYKGRHTRIKAQCSICGYIWEPMPSSLLRGSTHKGAVAMHKNILG